MLQQVWLAVTLPIIKQVSYLRNIISIRWRNYLPEETLTLGNDWEIIANHCRLAGFSPAIFAICITSNKLLCSIPIPESWIGVLFLPVKKQQWCFASVFNTFPCP